MKRHPTCIMATCCVPWDDDNWFLEPVFRRQVRSILAQGTKHLYVFGTAGEGYAVTDRQFDQIVDAFIDEMRQGDAEPMIGVIHLSLGTIVERIERCRSQGVRLFQISLPSWGALNQREVFEFFRQTCGRFTDCRFMHYNLPRTKRLVTPQEYATLSAEHPNLIATKNSNDSFSFTQNLLEAAPDLQHFLTETGFVYGSFLGECGLLASLVTNWGQVRRLFEAGRNRDAGTLFAMQKEMRIYHELFACVAETAHIDGAFDKLFCRVHDPEFPLRLLPPYTHATVEQFEQFKSALAARLPHWLPG